MSNRIDSHARHCARLILVCAAVTLLLLTACVSGTKPQSSYTSPTTGKTTVIESDREMCTSSCNADYNRCMDSQAASQGIPGTPSGMFGASAECRSELSDCLPGCKGR
jgi:hypothetical protein